MNHSTLLLINILILTFLDAGSVSKAQESSKMINVGKFHAKVVDSGDEGAGSWGWGQNPSYYDGFITGLFSSKAMFLGCKNFTDTAGVFHTVKISGHGQWESDSRNIWMPVPDDNGITIHRYYRYALPDVVVDGRNLTDKSFQFLSDHVDPEKIPGTADVMVESWINTDLGITIHQRVFGFSQENHDDYQIFEWTLTNTGNADPDPDIEYPGQTLEDVYFLRQLRYYEGSKGWASSCGEMPDDSLRISYGYPARWSDAQWDNFGNVNATNGFIQQPWFMGEATLFASVSATSPDVDDPNQPAMTGVQDGDLPEVVYHSNNLTATDKQNLYRLMSEGFITYEGDSTSEIENSRPGHHSIRFDERGYKYPDEAPWFGWAVAGFFTYGPYTLAPGDSIKIVWAQVMGTISAEQSFEIGTDWKSGLCEWGDMSPGGSTDILPPQYKSHPDLYGADQYSGTVNNWARDNWIFSGKDSLFRNAAAAMWAYRNDFNVPVAPPPPSLMVTGAVEGVRVEWGNESEIAADFAGYRVYRATGSFYPHPPYISSYLIGNWELIFECSNGVGDSLVHSYYDQSAMRGFDYYYCVTAFNDGTQNFGDVWGNPGQILESSILANMTTRSTYLISPIYAGPDTVTVKEYTVADITVLQNDSSFYGDSLYLYGFAFLKNSAAAINEDYKTIAYHAEPGFMGLDSFIYQITTEINSYPMGGGWIKVNVTPEENRETLPQQIRYYGPKEDLGGIPDVLKITDGFIVTGTRFFLDGGSAIFLMKTNTSGDSIWTKTLTSKSSAHAHAGSIQIANDGGFLIAGSIIDQDSGLPEMLLMKTNSDGDLMWTKTYNPGTYAYANSIERTADQGFVITGGLLAHSDRQDLFLMKLANNGDSLWIRTYEKLSDDYGNSVLQTADGGFIATGAISGEDSGNEYDLWIVKTDSSGDSLWTQIIDMNRYDEGNCIRPAHGGGFSILGTTDGVNTERSDLFLLKINPEGETLWIRTFDRVGGDEIGYDLMETNQGGYIVCATSGSPIRSGSGAWILNTDGQGNRRWQKLIGGIKYDLFTSVTYSHNNDFMLAGITTSFLEEKSGIWLVEFKGDPDISVAENITRNIPQSFYLAQNYPNPFNSGTTIEYDLPEKTDLTITIYNVIGQEVVVILNKTQDAGRYAVSWDGFDKFGKPAASGLYFYRMITNKSQKTRKMLLIR